MSKPLEVAFCTTLIAWEGVDAEAERQSDKTQQDLQGWLEKGYVVKLCSSAALGTHLFCHYVLEKEDD